MPNFNAVYGYVLKPSNGLRKEEEKWGEGQMTLDIDKEPVTPEEWAEVAEFIRNRSDYASVVVTHLVPLDGIPFQNKAEATGNEVLEGEIVDSE